MKKKTKNKSVKKKIPKEKVLVEPKVEQKLEPKKDWNIKILIDKVLYQGEGMTALEALQSIKPPQKIASKGIVTIVKGEQTREILFQVPRLRRLFYPNSQPILVKVLSIGFK